MIDNPQRQEQKIKYEKILLKQKRKDFIWLIEEGSPRLEDLKSFKDDHEIILKATFIFPEAISYATDELKNSKRFILKILKKNGLSLEFVNKEFRSNAEHVLEAVKNKGKALKFADKKLKSDRNIVLEAIRQNPISIAYADTKLKSDKSILLEAIARDGTYEEDWEVEFLS